MLPLSEKGANAASAEAGLHEVEERQEPAVVSREARLQEEKERLERARRQLLSAAVALGDGLISEGQLKAVRELVRERELRYEQLRSGKSEPPFTDRLPAPSPHQDPKVEAPMSQPAAARPSPAAPDSDGRKAEAVTKAATELSGKVASLERKLDQLETDFQRGRINPSQYHAVRRHYLDQHEVASHYQKKIPNSDRWRTVLVEGKTSLLYELYQTDCRAFAIYDLASRKRLFLQGELPATTQEALSLLATFGGEASGKTGERIFATELDDGSVLHLIPGQYTAALVAFTGEPPMWQVSTMKAVHQNFEVANRAAFSRGKHESLVFPNLNRVIRVGTPAP